MKPSGDFPAFILILFNTVTIPAKIGADAEVPSEIRYFILVFPILFSLNTYQLQLIENLKQLQDYVQQLQHQHMLFLFD